MFLARRIKRAVESRRTSHLVSGDTRIVVLGQSPSTATYHIYEDGSCLIHLNTYGYKRLVAHTPKVWATFAADFNARVGGAQ